MEGFGEKVQAGVDAAKGDDVKVPINPNADGFREKVAAATAGEPPVEIPIEPGAAGFEAKLAALLAENKALTASLGDTGKAADTTGAAAARLGGRWGLLNAVMGRSIPLFGGMAPGFLAAVGGVHLLIDGIAEFAAVLIPATVAAVAFGAAAAPTVQDIATQMQNLNTVTQATGKSLYPLTGGFAKVAAAVRPEVYQIFGDALTVIAAKTGEFGKIAVGAGHALDQLAARAAVALQSGGLSKFLQNAVPDLQKLGTVAGNVFGIFGNLLKTLPGYANVILDSFVNVSHAVETVTGSGAVQRVIGFGLAFHGAFLYAGLGATLLAKAASGGLGAISGWAEKAALAANKSELLGGAGNKAALGLAGMSDAAAGAAALPWAWIAVAAAGVGILGYKLLTAKDATQQWTASLQQVMLAAPAVKGFTLLQQDQALVAGRLATAQVQLGKAQQFAGTAAGHVAQLSHNVTGAYMAQVAKIGQLQSAQKQLTSESTLYNYRLDKLAVSFGGTTKAMGLLTAAGITMKQMMDPGALAQITQQVLATVQAYQAMGQRAGVLGADLNALSIAASDQVSAMTKLNQAWDGVIGVVSGGQNAFITFQQGMLSVNLAFQQTGGTARTVTNTFAAASAAAKKAGASMTGLNAPSLQLRSSWQAAYGGGAQLIDALRMMSSVSPGGFPSITRAMKDTIAQLVPFGKQSSATRAELVSMAQEVQPGIKSFQDLTTWLGNTHNAARDLNSILAKSGISIQDLTADAKKMSDILQSAVISKFTLAKMAADGTNAAISKLATDMGNSAPKSKIAGDAMALFTKLTRDGGYSAQAAAALISSMTGTIFKVPKGWTTKFKADTGGALANVHGLAAAMAQIKSKRVAIQVDIIAHGGIPSAAGGGGPALKALGGVIPGYAPGHDSVPAVLSPGEGVLVPEAVRALGPEFVHAANAKFGGARVRRGNKTGHFASGGIAASAQYGFLQDIFNIDVNFPGGQLGTWGGVYGSLGSELRKGKSASAADKAGEAIAKAFARGSLTTVSAIQSESAKAIAALKLYYTGPAATRLETAIKSQTAAMEKLATASAKVSATISAMKSFAKNETSSLAGFSDISNITGTTNPTTGVTAPVTGQQIRAGLGKMLGQLHKFFEIIGRLKKAKVDKAMIEQVIALGPVDGITYGEAILSGGAKLIREINKDERYIRDDERKIGQRAADIQYGQNISKGFLSVLERDKARLKKEMGALGDEIAKELARALGIPVKDITGLSGSGGSGHHAAHHKRSPNADHHAHAPHHHHHPGDNPGGKLSGAPNITVNLNGSKGKLSHEEVAGISHEIAKQLALA